MKTTRMSYREGDLVVLRADAPAHMKEMVKRYPEADLILQRRDYGGWQVHLVGKKNKQDSFTEVHQQYSGVSTKCFQKAMLRAAIIKQIESLQTELEKTERQYKTKINQLQAKISIMDELQINEIDEEALEYARKFSEKMNVSLKEAYQALLSEA